MRHWLPFLLLCWVSPRPALAGSLSLGFAWEWQKSNLGAGSQAFPQSKDKLRYGVSITDACIDWPTTESLVREIHAALAPRFR